MEAELCQLLMVTPWPEPKGTLSPPILPFPLLVESWGFLLWRCHILARPCLCSPWRNTRFVERPGDEHGQ